MIRSVLAVLAGFIVMAILVMVATILAVRFILRRPASAMMSPSAVPPSGAYLVANLGASGIAAVIGGYTTAAIAAHGAIAHGVALAVLMVAMSIASMRQAGTGQPRWYQVVLMTAMPALAVAGAALRGTAGVASASIAPAAQPVADAIPAHDSFAVQSRVLGEPRRINVHLPPHYGSDDTTHFPVLYMPDGGLDEDFPHIANVVDSLTAAGTIRPVIVVGIPNTERRRDLTGPTRVKSDSEIAPRVGESAAFRRFLRDELIPEIDRRYRTTPERGIIGESLAGLFVMETFLQDPALFTHYVAFDPSLWWNNGSLVDSARTRIAAFGRSPRTLYFATSHEPSTAVGAARIDSLLRALQPPGLRWTYDHHPELEHATIFHALQRPGLIEALGVTHDSAPGRDTKHDR